GGFSTGAGRMETRKSAARDRDLSGRFLAFLRALRPTHSTARTRRSGRIFLAAEMNLIVLYLLLLKATITSFSGLTSLPVVRNDFVVQRQILTDRQLNAAVVAGRAVPGPNGLYVVSVGYFIDGVPGACVAWLAVITPAFVMIPLLQYVGKKAEKPSIKSAIQALTFAAAGLIIA